MIKKLKEEKNVDWESQPEPFRFGTFVKRERYLKEAEDLKTKEKLQVFRTRVTPKQLQLKGFSQANIDLIFRKYWEMDEDLGKK